MCNNDNTVDVEVILPVWLVNEAEKANIDLSEALIKALKEQLGIK